MNSTKSCNGREFLVVCLQNLHVLKRTLYYTQGSHSANDMVIQHSIQVALSPGPTPPYVAASDRSGGGAWEQGY